MTVTIVAAGPELPYVFKISYGVPVRWGINISGNFQIYDTPGSGLFLAAPYFAANRVYTTAVAGQPIVTSTTGGGITINLLEPNTIFADYYKIFDMRFSKTMLIGRNRITALAEFDNLFNMRNVVAVNESFGATWLRPSALQRGRNIRFGIQYRF